jgi:hypothetical protein
MQVVEPNGHHRAPAWTREGPEPLVPAEHPLVLVEWHDAWFDLEQASTDDGRADYPVRTVGFLLREGPEFLSLAQEVLPEGEGFRAVTHIPLAIVERVQRLSPGMP